MEDKTFFSQTGITFYGKAKSPHPKSRDEWLAFL
jgi:hypothetical protein